MCIPRCSLNHLLCWNLSSRLCLLHSSLNLPPFLSLWALPLPFLTGHMQECAQTPTAFICKPPEDMSPYPRPIPSLSLLTRPRPFPACLRVEPTPCRQGEVGFGGSREPHASLSTEDVSLPPESDSGPQTGQHERQCVPFLGPHLGLNRWNQTSCMAAGGRRSLS